MGADSSPSRMPAGCTVAIFKHPPLVILAACHVFQGKPTRTLTQTAEAATVTHGLMLHHRWMHHGGSEVGGDAR